MDNQEPQAPNPPEPHTSLPIALLAVLALGLATAMALYYQHWEKARARAETNLNGFDLNLSQNAQTPAPAGETGAAPALPGAAGTPRSAMNMIEGGIPQPAGARRGRPSEENLTRIAMANESAVAAIAMAYTRKYPVIAQFGRDWMSYPDLRKLNNDYMADHDPAAFMRGVASSKNFAALARRYAGRPEIQALVKDVVAHAPADATAAAMNYLSDNRNIALMANSLAQALGLPPGLINAGGSEQPQIDADSLLKNILQSGGAAAPASSNGAPTLSPPGQ